MNANIYKYGRGLVLELESKTKKSYGEIAPLKGFSKETTKEAFRQLMRVLSRGVHEDLYPSVAFGIFSAFAAQKETPSDLPKVPVKQKVKIGHLNADGAAAIVKAGDRLDVNRKWTLKQAIEFGRRFPQNFFEYIEEPVDRFEDLKTFVEATGHHIALDETLREKSLEEISSLPGIKALVIKPTLQKNFFTLLHQKRYPIVLSSSYETPIGIKSIVEWMKRLEIPLLKMGLIPHQSMADSLEIHEGLLDVNNVRFSPCNAQSICTLKNIPDDLL
ncbi:MAG: o-succinylbenzoate synthase [Chlamydiia bacterium]|nr:o-succinylbenzoate synthase [Chlamydiia bacterium]MCH9615420.1 o-succinylbenzoate synthase [Chlamydiia bacterium]MCH9628258.1 o-succinylbenzoate synthase [Chlamydiia bacterium]